MAQVYDPGPLFGNLLAFRFPPQGEFRFEAGDRVVIPQGWKAFVGGSDCDLTEVEIDSAVFSDEEWELPLPGWLYFVRSPVELPWSLDGRAGRIRLELDAEKLIEVRLEAKSLSFYPLELLRHEIEPVLRKAVQTALESFDEALSEALYDELNHGAHTWVDECDWKSGPPRS